MPSLFALSDNQYMWKKKYLARTYLFNLHINLTSCASDHWICGCYSGKRHSPLHLLMSKSVKNLEQMLLEGAGVGCGVAVQGASRDVELVSWPHTSAAAMHREGERAPDNASVHVKVIMHDLNPLCCVQRRAGRVPVLLCRGRSPSTNFPALTCVWSALLPQVGEEKGLTDAFLENLQVLCR